MPASSAPFQGLSLDDRDPHAIQSWMPIWEWLYRYYFRVQTSGWHHIPDGKALYVATHNGGIAAPDLHMFAFDWFRRFGCDNPKGAVSNPHTLYGLAHPKIWQASPWLAEQACRMGAVQAHPKMAIAAFQRGASVLVYPGGVQEVFRPHRLRHKICFAERRGFIKLALRQEVPIVPLISWGAHDTLFVVEDCYEQARWLHQHGMPWLFGIDPEVLPIYLGAPWGLAVGPLPNLPLPAQIHTRVCQPIYFDRYGRFALRDNAYIDECYTTVLSQMQHELDLLIAQVG
ncbi:MAG TPA: glycerol acyltransferase [Leptolyngbyaceae cyanobacterium]